MPFDPVESQPVFAELEEGVLDRWRRGRVFERSLEQTRGGELVRMYDGPPTANGLPGVHHVEARVFKDIIPRYLTMKGYHVPRKAGWDCHGIPVEIEVEKTLGFTGKPQIEKFGVADFNKHCRDSVTRYLKEWERLTERIGYWTDMRHPYWTMDPAYMDSVWWSLKEFHDRGLLYEDFRVAPYCPRCGTALSDHEVAQGYATTKDRTLTARLPLVTGPLAPGGSAGAEGASLVVWTTMPWTIVFSTLAVIGPHIRYVLATGGRARDHLVVVGVERVAEVLGPGSEIVREVAHSELVGARYRGPFEYMGPGTPADPDGDPASWRFVVSADWVSTDTGTGIVSTAPAYGEDDMRVAREHGAPIIQGVGLDGRFAAAAGPFAGRYVRDCDEDIVASARDRDLVIRSDMFEHTFPFCWRCKAPLIYYAKRSWYMATTRFRDRLLSENDKTDWRPEHIRDGRYGNWLAHNVDWALSRERYWGTPLPIWRCESCQETVAAGSRAELGALAGCDFTQLDPHRPYVDEITFPCMSCSNGKMRRVPEVIDAWYDSGAMPFAQLGYPHVPGSAEEFEALFPADYTAEAIDQTRGWWYSLEAIAVGLFDQNSYRRAICLGHIVDAEGRKMSKSLGNVMDPWRLIEEHGADALRWLFLVEGNPWQSRHVGSEPLAQVTRRFLLTIWNVYYFFVMYANGAGWTPDRVAPPAHERPVLDRYILAELGTTVSEVDRALSDFDITRAGKRIASFVNSLSNWYVRCSRDRFWLVGTLDDKAASAAADNDAAFATLYECLTTLCGLLAPFTPFLADEIYVNLVGSAQPGTVAESVHLTVFPSADSRYRDDQLIGAMEIAKRVTSLGREARANGNVPVRCPLRRAVVVLPADKREHFAQVSETIATELNVKSVELIGGDGTAEPVRYHLKPSFRALGPAFGKRTPQVAGAIAATDAAAAMVHLRDHGWFPVDLDGQTVQIEEDKVQVIEEPLIGWVIAAEGGASVALDTELDDELRREWAAREVIRALNDLRKRRGLDITDRIRLRLEPDHDPDGQLAAVLESHSDEIAAAILATAIDSFGPVRPENATIIEIGSGRLKAELTRESLPADTRM